MANKSKTKAYLIVGGLALLCIFWLLFDSKNDSAAEIKFAKVIYGKIEDLVIAQGKVEPKEYVDIGVQVSGQLKKIYPEIGAVVKSGDLLAEIDATVYKAQVDVSKARLKTLLAQLAEQEAQVRFQEKQFTRNLKLHESQATSKELVEESQTSLEVAQAKVASMRAQLEEAQSTLEGAEANLSYTKIFAPMDGTISNQIAREGQTLNANQQAPVVLQIANLNTMTVRTQVAEADVLKLTIGMPVYFTVLGNSERRWKASLRQILPSPEVINEVVLYNALIDIENTDGQLMSGMSTQNFFVVASSDNALIIPIQSLAKREKDKDNEKGKAFTVKTKSGEKLVHVGIINRSNAEVKEGLTTDDEVEIVNPNPADAKTTTTPRMRVPML